MSVLKPIFDCLFGTFDEEQMPPSRSPESIASDIVTKILDADDPVTLHKQLTSEISTANLTESIARSILAGLAKAIETGAQMATTALEAVTKAKDAAIEFSTEHPVYATLIAFGVLAILMPWALEALGFGELGPIEGSFAAGWQRMYGGWVPKRALFGFFQRLGMKWRWYS
ncbi:hypothetical protein BDV18DRAFT_144444 [Aspergillus unguis]